MISGDTILINNKRSIKDLIFLVVASGFFGVLWIVYGMFYNLLDPLLKPLNLNGLLQGVWYISGGFCGVIIRKRYSALIGELLPSFIELSLSNWGIYNLIYGLLQGAIAELVFNAYGYKNCNVKTMMLANIAATVVGGICDYILYDYAKLSLPYNFIKISTQVVSTVIFTILGGLLISKLLKLGYLKQYNISKVKSWLR